MSEPEIQHRLPLYCTPACLYRGTAGLDLSIARRAGWISGTAVRSRRLVCVGRIVRCGKDGTGSNGQCRKACCRLVDEQLTDLVIDLRAENQLCIVSDGRVMDGGGCFPLLCYTPLLAHLLEATIHHIKHEPLKALARGRACQHLFGHRAIVIEAVDHRIFKDTGKVPQRELFLGVVGGLLGQDIVLQHLARDVAHISHQVDFTQLAGEERVQLLDDSR